MRKSRRDAIYAGLSSIAKRVYDFTPEEGSSSIWDMIVAMRNANVPAPETRVVQGCLAALIRSGVVREPKKGVYQRVPVPANEIVEDVPPETDIIKQADAPEESSTQTVSVTSEPIVMKTPTETAPSTPLEKIGKLSGQVIMLMTELKVLHDAIETVAIEVEEQFATRDAESQKLKQLQQLLKGLV